MVTVAELTRAVDNAFATTAQGLEPWPDPHPDRAPLDEEYSRVLDPRKWRIIPARAEAWCIAAVDLCLVRATVPVALEQWRTESPGQRCADTGGHGRSGADAGWKIGGRQSNSMYILQPRSGPTLPWASVMRLTSRC